MTPYKLEDGKLVRDDSDAISVSSPKRKLFSALCLQVDRAEAAEARVAQLESSNAELTHLYSNVTMALYNIDRKTFGPLTAREGIAELKRQLEQAQAMINELKDLCPRMSEDDPIAPAIADCLSRYKQAKS